MKPKSLAAKTIYLAVVPVILTALLMGVAIFIELNDLKRTEIKTVSESTLQRTKSEIKTTLEVALSSIKHLRQGSPDTLASRQEQARNVLRQVRYGERGYLFALTYKGVNKVNGAKPANENSERWDKQDPTGKYHIREIIAAGQSGGGYATYSGVNPGSKDPAPKISYVLPIEEWQWVIGTGTYLDDIDKQISAVEEHYNDIINSNLASIALLVLCTVGVSIVVSSLVAAKITGNLRQTTDALEDLVKGEGDLTRRLRANSQDEVGEISRSFNQFMENMQQMIGNIRGESHNVLSSVTQLNELASRNRERSNQQTSEMDMVVTAVTEMSATATDIAKDASEAAEAATHADEKTTQGRELLEKSIASINNLVNGINSAAEVLQNLEQETENIGSVLAVIQGVAEQTNLLALNAAIEAARAGEQGRGFAVVADEVRTLASRTQQSTEEIRDMIGKLQEGARNAVTVMNGSQNMSQDTVAAAQESDQMLKEAVEAVSTISRMNFQIATAAEEQTSVTDEINRNIVQLSELNIETSNDTNEVDTVGTDLNNYGTKLGEMVNSFKTA